MEMPEGLHKGASFVKILGHNFREQLQIPRDFTKTINGYTPHRFLIESSMSNKCWRVEVEKDKDGMTYLRGGWTAFADAHCLESGDIILFQYEEVSIFHVTIYDQNGCKKNTLFDSKECQFKSPKVYNIIEEENKGDDEGQVDQKLLREDHLLKRRQLSTQQYNNVISKKRQAVSEKYQRSSVILSEDNKSFSITLAKKYQFTRQAVVTEMKLARKTLVILELNDANWSVNLARKKVINQVYFSGGWKCFLEENNIVLGDTLSFKFVSDNIAQVDVTRRSEPVSHLNNDAESFPVDDNNVINEKKYRKSSPSVGENNKCFSVTLAKKYQFNQLLIPGAVDTEMKLARKKEMVLELNDSNWSVNLSRNKSDQVCFCGGWKNLLKENNIVLGDVLSFKFNSDSNAQVLVTRRSDAVNHLNNDAESSPADDEHRKSSDDQIDEASFLDLPMDDELIDLTNRHGVLDGPPGFPLMAQRIL